MTICHHYHRIHPRLRGAHFNAQSGTAFPSGSLSPAQVLTAYGFKQNQFAGAVPIRIGIGSLGGGVVQADLDNAIPTWGMQPGPNLTARTVGGATNDPTVDQDSNVENMLDILIASHTWWWLTGTPALITITFGPNASGGMEAVTRDLNTAGVSVASWSWGSAASGWDPAERASLAKAFASSDVVFCAAAGDNSIDDGTAAPSADYPCSDVNVWAVGGTRLVVDASGARASEIAWGDGAPGDEGGGGGFDPTQQTPPWQVASGIHDARGVPDTSANADPVSGWQISANGSWTVVGGTSASSPFTAALIAVAMGVAKGRNTWTPPLMRAVYTDPQIACNDITQGSNGDPAVQGWDPATGLGSPNGLHFIAAIAALLSGVPPVPKPPIGPVTLAQAISWAKQGIAAGHVLQSRASAETNAAAGLTKNWPK